MPFAISEIFFWEIFSHFPEISGMVYTIQLSRSAIPYDRNFNAVSRDGLDRISRQFFIVNPFFYFFRLPCGPEGLSGANFYKVLLLFLIVNHFFILFSNL